MIDAKSPVGESVKCAYDLLVWMKIESFTKPEESKEKKEKPARVFRERSDAELADAMVENDQEGQRLLRLLFMMNSPSDFAQAKGDEGSNVVLYLRNILKRFPKNKNHVETCSVT